MIVTEHFVENIFSPLNCFGDFVENLWVYIQFLYSVSLMYTYIIFTNTTLS